jgi:hypothetical protein
MKQPKIAFVHIPKSCGVSIGTWFFRNLPKDVPYQSSWMNMHRDWLLSELRMFKGQSPIYVHNHSPNWPLEAVEEYKQQDFYIFAWIRESPYDFLCSFYHFFVKTAKQYKERDQENNFPAKRDVVHSSLYLSIDDWLQQWGNTFGNALPMRTYKMFDFFKVVTDDFAKDFKDFVTNDLGLEYKIPIQHKNKSSNKGWKYYRENDIITDKTAQFLEQTEFVNNFQELVAAAKNGK